MACSSSWIIQPHPFMTFSLNPNSNTYRLVSCTCTYVRSYTYTFDRTSYDVYTYTTRTYTNTRHDKQSQYCFHSSVPRKLPGTKFWWFISADKEINQAIQFYSTPQSVLKNKSQAQTICLSIGPLGCIRQEVKLSWKLHENHRAYKTFITVVNLCHRETATISITIVHYLFMNYFIIIILSLIDKL